MRLTLVKSSSKGDTEPELTIFCNQVSLPVDRLGHQPSHRIFDLQSILPTRCAWGKGGTAIVGVAS